MRTDGAALEPPVLAVAEALSLCRARGVFDLAEVASLAGLPSAADAAAALGSAAFRDPERDGRWVAAGDYLAGDVRSRLHAARTAAATDSSYARNVAALDAVQPPELGPLEIAVTLGAPWIAPEDVAAFAREVLGGQVVVWYLPAAAYWKVVHVGGKPHFGVYSTSRMSGYDLLAAGLNGRLPIVYDVVPVRPGKRGRIRNAAESLAAQEKLTALQERFRTWLWEDADRTARLCTEYNRRFNSHVPVRYDGTGLTFPGLADAIELWPWQRDIVARLVSSPATLCGHAVGAGKTLSMLTAALTCRRFGIASRPLITVPAHLVEQTAREARRAYPGARFLVAGDDGDDWTRACRDGDWDAVIVSHGRFSSVPVAPETELAWLEHARADTVRQRDAGKAGRWGHGVLNRRVARFDERIATLTATPRPAVTFEDLGVDLLLVDEAHYFKRLPVVSRMEGVSLGSSRRAADLLLKARLLRERRGTLPSLALFTGTPWSNTLAETFVWQSFVQPEVLADAGLDSFDAWAAVFVEYESAVEVTPDSSGLRVVQRPVRIRNLPELQRMLARSADILPSEALGIGRPERHERTVVCDPMPGQAAYIRSLAVRVDKLRREKVRSDPGGDNMLVVCGDGRRAALDPMLVGVREPSPKLAAVADEVARLHDEHAAATFAGSDATGVLQLVFCDQGVPGSDGLQSYGRLRILLAERGIPAERVRWVHDAHTAAERERLFARCRAGEVSVLIGSTDKLGVGTNVQHRLRAVHHADAPWRPSDVEQREGRALRPGNGNTDVDVVRYVTRGTFDAFMWQTLQRKATFVAQLHRADGDVRTADDVGEIVLSYAEVKSLAAGNPLLLEHAQAAATVSRLRLLRAVDTQTVTSARQRLATATADRHRLAEQERMLQAALARTSTAPAPDALDAAADALRSRIMQRGTQPAFDDPAPIRAPFGALGVELLPAGGWRVTRPDRILLRVTLEHRRVDEVTLPVTPLRRSAASCRTSVAAAATGWVAALDARVAEVGTQLAEALDDAAHAERVIAEHRFARLDELAAAEAHLAELSVALETSIDDPAA